MIHGILYKTPLMKGFRNAIEKEPVDLVLCPLLQEIISTSTSDFWLAQAMEKDEVPLSKKRLVILGTPPRAVIVAWARLDNREELAKQLAISTQGLKALSCAELILHAYLKFGDTCTTQLYGDFSFAIYDYRDKQLFCARDQMGIKPFYYYDTQDVFVFSSSLSLFHRIPFIQVNPSMEWASRFLIKSPIVMDFEKTAYPNLVKLPPAHQLMVTTDAMTKKQYFTFHTNKITLKNSAEYVEYYQEQLDRAVKCRVQVHHPLGSELSGGIDSSTVTAYAAQHFPGQAQDFHSFSFACLDNEPRSIAAVNQYLKLAMSHVCYDPSLFNFNPYRILNTLGAPVQHLNATVHEIFYANAQNQGVKTLLSGFGGDEFVTTLYGHLYLHELLENKQYVRLYQNLNGNPLMRALRFSKFIYFKCAGKKGVVNRSFAQAYAQRWPAFIVRDELVQHYDLKTHYDATGELDYGYQNLDQFTLENRLAPFISTRTEECTLMAATYGIDYRWPLLDVRLIQCFLSIPSSEKYSRGIGRYLHKRAIAHMVPKEVVNQYSKYMGESVTFYEPRHRQLNQELHPALWDVVNMSKLLDQEKEMKRILNQDSSQFFNNTLFMHRKNIRQVNELDHWLKYYFSNGCVWETKPTSTDVPL